MKIFISREKSKGKKLFHVFFADTDTKIKENYDSMVLEYPFNESNETSSVMEAIMNLEHSYDSGSNMLTKELNLVLSKIFEAGYNFGQQNIRQSLAKKLNLIGN